RNFTALRDGAAPCIDVDVFLDSSADQNHRNAFSPLNRKSRNSICPRHSANTKKPANKSPAFPFPQCRMLGYGFFFLVPILVAIPGEIWLSMSSPCLACWPQGPF